MIRTAERQGRSRGEKKIHPHPHPTPLWPLPPTGVGEEKLRQPERWEWAACPASPAEWCASLQTVHLLLTLRKCAWASRQLAKATGEWQGCPVLPWQWAGGCAYTRPSVLLSPALGSPALDPLQLKGSLGKGEFARLPSRKQRRQEFCKAIR